MDAVELVQRLSGHPSLAEVHLVVLYGSRARGQATPQSDWDFGVITEDSLVRPRLAAALSSILETDHIDVVDLERASALLRYRAARDGIALFEATPGAFERYRLTATQFWCDAESVIRLAQAEVLAETG